MAVRKHYSDIQNHGTHLSLCAASRAGDTIEVVVLRDGTIYLDVMDRIGAKPRKNQGSITLGKVQAAELRDLLSRDFRKLDKPQS